MSQRAVVIDSTARLRNARPAPRPRGECSDCGSEMQEVTHREIGTLRCPWTPQARWLALAPTSAIVACGQPYRRTQDRYYTFGSGAD